MLVEKGCCEKETGDVVIKTLQKKLNKNHIDIEYFNQVLKADCEFILDDDDVNFVK